MEDDDDFGDLYTDVLHVSPAATSIPSNQKSASIAAAGGGGAGNGSDEEDDKALRGSSFPFAEVPESSSIDRERQVSAGDAEDDWLLGGDPTPVEEPANWVDDDEEVVGDSKEAVRGLSSESGGARVPGQIVAEEASRISNEEVGGALDAEGSLDKRRELLGRDNELAIPGLATPAVPNGVLVKASESDDWDSGSEDDLQIVLNDTGHDLLGLDRRDGGGSDEDDEDLVIVTDDDQRHHHQALEEQDWGDDALQSSVDGEKKDMLEVAKASGVAPNVAGAGIGYSNHSFHSQHHSMFKYVRPGATPAPRGPAMAAAGAPGQVRPPAFGALAGRGRGDWRPAGGIGFSNMQKGFHSGYGLPTWSNIASGRPFGGGLDFSLPAHKTVFDIDIESFEEKPWRHPGVDISDFFNFELDEEHWKEYCKQLEQLRLESTMQGKIRVYESGRSEQDYDPDLPPELAAATGHNNLPADNINHDKSENGLADLSEQGKGSSCIRPALPTGRPIQVESGYGERLPSIDTRPPRFRDFDAVIEIVLQDNLDDSRNSNNAFERPENNFGRENHKGFHDVDEDDRPTVSESEFPGRFLRSNVQQRESVARRIPSSAEGDGILPFPSESSRQYNSSPKSRSPIDATRSSETEQFMRPLQRTPYEKNSISSGNLSESFPHRNMHSDKHEGYHKESASDGKEINKASDSPPSDIVRESSMEPKDVEHDDRLTLGDSHEGDGGEASDFRVSSETVGDDGFISHANRQKFTSCIEQSGVQDNDVGDGSRLTHSDNSRARSGSSRGYQKIHETGEEVMQIHSSKHMGDLIKHHEEDDRRQRDDYGRDSRRDSGRNRLRGRETVHESYAQKDWDSGSGHTFRGRSVDFEREMDASVGAWHRREDDIHYRQIKDEDIRRVYNDDIKPRERSKARMIDRKEKIEDHVKKRIDEGDWRGHGRDECLRHRERNDLLMNRRDNQEEGQMKRKRDVELPRRERAEKEESLHGYRVREVSHRKKRIREDVVDHRKREDDVRTKSKIEERHSSKQKDENWYQRDREDRQQLNLVHDDTLVREERRFASRSSRPMEKIFAGAGRNKEDLKVAGSEKGYHDNDRRRHNEQSKRGDRNGEENESVSKVRGDTHAREKRFNGEQRNMRYERSSAQPDRPSGTSDEHQLQKERHRESNKKVEDSEPVGQKGASGKRKRGGHNTHRTELNSKGSSEQQSNNRSAMEGKKTRAKTEQTEASLPLAARRGDEDPASDGESHDSRRGRSKLERWTSHKERDYSIIESNIQTSSIVREVEDPQDTLTESVKDDPNKPDNIETNADDPLQITDKVGEDRDRHLDTVAKLKMRSERFKLPMPGEKDKDLTANKKVESEAPTPCIQNEPVSAASADLDIKHERPARKRKWTSS
ncbi:FIP1[V]-like protein [Phalaenopsis equestris]|uniref:FIP1[V]-like protein n=1 Tax=Phalaenopsis equestris TaxID=78828 RepID=UPI0009E62F5F|nr:FIP1[V]-like protein [Phalaenopsis equestris]